MRVTLLQILDLIEDEQVLALLLEETASGLDELLRFFVQTVVFGHFSLNLVLKTLELKLKIAHMNQTNIMNRICARYISNINKAYFGKFIDI